jgi:hypothetical protein
MRLVTADGRELWLAYGMNVHPGGDLASTAEAIRSTVLSLKERLGVRGPFGLAVRWSDAGLGRGAEAARASLRELLQAHDLHVFSGNAFVMGTFHGRPLKEEVYRPTWADPARRRYTLDFARTLVALAGGLVREISLSTSPCSWKGWEGGPGERRRCAAELAACARELRRLAEAQPEDRRVHVRLGLEPEPGCTLETTEEVLAFFAQDLAACLEPGDRPYLGVCYDVCHQAVEWEDAEEALRAIVGAGLPVVKLQASCALELPDAADPAGREALARFDESVYLHQVGARDADGTRHMAPDLGPVLEDATWQRHGPWRSHFHVPVFRREVAGGLRTTQEDLRRALLHVAREPVTHHLEIETYTWDVLPEAERRAGSGFDLVDALEREMRWVLDVLASAGVRPRDVEGAR